MDGQQKQHHSFINPFFSHHFFYPKEFPRTHQQFLKYLVCLLMGWPTKSNWRPAVKRGQNEKTSGWGGGGGWDTDTGRDDKATSGSCLPPHNGRKISQCHRFPLSQGRNWVRQTYRQTGPQGATTQVRKGKLMSRKGRKADEWKKNPIATYCLSMCVSVCVLAFMQSRSHRVNVNILARSYSSRMLTMKDNYHFSMQAIETGALISIRGKMAKSCSTVLITSFINELRWQPL